MERQATWDGALCQVRVWTTEGGSRSSRCECRIDATMMAGWLGNGLLILSGWCAYKSKRGVCNCTIILAQDAYEGHWACAAAMLVFPRVQVPDLTVLCLIVIQ